MVMKDFPDEPSVPFTEEDVLKQLESISSQQPQEAPVFTEEDVLKELDSISSAPIPQQQDTAPVLPGLPSFAQPSVSQALEPVQQPVAPPEPSPQPQPMPVPQPIVQQAPEQDYGPQDVDIGYGPANASYMYYRDAIDKAARGEMTDEALKSTEKQLASMIVSDVYIDAASQMAGNRAFDEKARKTQAQVTARDYRDQVDSSLLYGGLSEVFEPLTDREDYADYAIRQVIKRLHETKAPTTLLAAVQEEYAKTKDDFGELTDMDVLITGESLRNRTAKTFAQMLSVPLNAIAVPGAFAVALASGRTRNPGEPNDNLFVLKENTDSDVGVLGLTNDPARAKALGRIANRSYQPSSDPSLIGDDSIKMHPSDILYIHNNISPWQRGLKKHIAKKLKELGPIPDMHPKREEYERYRRDPSRIYDFLKNFGAYSYVDALDSEFGEFLEGYPPIAPPKDGWVYEAAAKATSARIAKQLKGLGLVKEGEGRETEETPGLLEMLGDISLSDFARESSRQMMGPAVATGVLTPFSASPTDDPFSRVDILPIEAERINRERIREGILAGEFGDLGDNVNAVQAVMELAGPNASKYNTVFKEFGRNFLRMMGPAETAKATVMAIAGLKKFGLPSLLPGVEVGGMLSQDDMAVFGDDDIFPLMTALDISEDDVNAFWNDTPGFAIAMIPGVTGAIGRVGSAGARMAGSGVRSIAGLMSRDLSRMSPKQISRAIINGFKSEKAALDSDITVGAETREASRPRTERVVQTAPDEIMPLNETATTLRNEAASTRERAAQASQTGDSSASTLNQVADSYEAAAKAVDKANDAAFREDMAKGKRTLVDELLPTRVKEKKAGPDYRGIRNLKPQRDDGIARAERRIGNKVSAQRRLDKQTALTDPSYVSPGATGLNKALSEVALELDRGIVDRKFREEFVFGREQSMALKLADNGVTDPLVYAELLPDAPIRGKMGIAELVFRAEESRFSAAKAEFHEAMRSVAELRKVDVQEVYKDTYVLNVADDMVKAGIWDSNAYALLGMSDDAAKAYAKRGKSKGEKPRVRNKKFGDDVLVKVKTEVPVRGFDQKSARDLINDAAYGAARTLIGRKPANILDNRLRQVQGKGIAKGTAIAGEAALLSTFEFLKSPFAFVNFPSWMADFAKYMYMNSTGTSAFQRGMRALMDASLSPSVKLGNELYAKVTEIAGKRTVRGYEIEALAKRLGDEDAASVDSAIRSAMEDVELSEQAGSSPSIRLLDNNQLSSEMKNKIATAMLAGDGAYIEVPSGPNGTQKIYLRETFDLEYKVDGEWINAWEAPDQIKALKTEKKEAKARRDQLRQEEKALIQESERVGDRVNPPRPEDLSRLRITDPGELASPPDRGLMTRIGMVQSEINTINAKLKGIAEQMQDIESKFGTAEDVFKIRDGKVTGVQDIRFSLKDTIEGPVDQIHKTLLGIANAYVRPLQLGMMEMAANLAVGENNFRLSLEAAKPKDTVSIIDLQTGKRRAIRTFKGKSVKENERRAAEFAAKIREEYAASGNEANIAEATTVDMASGDTAILGKRDMKFKGYNAVANTADYMSSYFTETALLDYMHAVLKSGMDADTRLAAMQQVSKLLVKMYPEDAIKRVKEKYAKRKDLTDAQLASLLMRGIKDGEIAAPSAAGSGRFFKERLWAKSLEFDQRKDFYGLYSNTTRKAHAQLLKRNEHYRLMNVLRENGLILTKTEILKTPGLKERQFVSMDEFSKKHPGILDPIPDAYVARDIADGLYQQQNLINNVIGAEDSLLRKVTDFGLGANRMLKRGAVVAYLNGTVARNFVGGVVVQALMGEIPATMKYFRMAKEANDAIKKGLMPKDPKFKDLSIRMGGPGRSVLELDIKRKERAVNRQQEQQIEYITSLLSGDEDAMPLGEAVQRQSIESKNMNEVAGVLGERNSLSKFSETFALSSDPADVPKSLIKDKARPAAEAVIETVETVSDKLTTGYGTIDDILRLAYAYELSKKGISTAEAASRALKVFYDYPNIPPVAQLLRDNALVGIPFIGYQLWSTKAFGNYFEKNPLRAAIIGSFALALEQATRDTMQLSTIYTDVAEQEVKSTIPMPGIFSSRTTVPEQARLSGAGVDPMEARVKLGQAQLDKGALSVGIATDYNALNKAIIRSREEDLNPLQTAVLVVDAVSEGMLGGLVGMGLKYAKGETIVEKDVQKKLMETSDAMEGGGLIIDTVDDITQSALQTLGYAVSDARGLAKMVSAMTGKPYAGQDSAVIETFTNALGLTMRVMDPRLTKETFSNIGQSKIGEIRNRINAFNRRKLQTEKEKGPTLYRTERNLLRNAINEFEAAEDVFKRGRESEGERVRQDIVSLMKGMLKYRPDNPEFQDSYQDLLEYYLLSKPDTQ